MKHKDKTSLNQALCTTSDEADTDPTFKRARKSRPSVRHPKRSQTPHDKAFKQMLKDVEIAREFFSIHLPQDLKDYCDLSTLRISDTSYVDGHQAHLSDILYQVTIHDEAGYLYVLIEHVSEATELTAFQVLKYQISILQQHLAQLPKAQRKHAKLPIVIPLLFYRGEQSPYPYSTDVMDCFQNSELARKVFLRPLPLVDLSIIPDEVLKTHKSIALLELIQKHIHARDLVHQLKKWTEQDRLHLQASLQFFEMMIQYIWTAGRFIEAQEFIYIIEHTDIEREYIETMQTVAQQLRSEGLYLGRKEGIQEGMQAGIDQEKHTIAKNMIQQGSEDAFIALVTGLSQEDIQRLKEEVLV